MAADPSVAARAGTSVMFEDLRHRAGREEDHRAMPVDVLTETVIARPRAEVAAFAADPDNATAWYENIKAVEWRTSPPLAVGSRIAFVAQFLGRGIEYT